MKEKPNIDCEKYRQIAQMAKMGWWESDLKNRQYICSDFIIDLLGLESDRISFEDFHERIREDHRRRLRNEYFSLTNIETYEQMFPIRAKDRDIWVYSKISFKQPDEEGYKNMIGYLQCIDKQTGETSEMQTLSRLTACFINKTAFLIHYSLFCNRMILHRSSIKYWQISSNKPKETVPIYSK